jgi:hypothetical protein
MWDMDSDGEEAKAEVARSQCSALAGGVEFTLQ